MSKALVALSLSFSSAGCAHVTEALATLAKVASYASSVGDVAETASARFFQAHPNPYAQEKVDEALLVYRLLTQAYLETSDNLQDVKEAYHDLYLALVEAGVIEGIPKSGGAQSLYPPPGPVDLPTPEEFNGRL